MLFLVVSIYFLVNLYYNMAVCKTLETTLIKKGSSSPLRHHLQILLLILSEVKRVNQFLHFFKIIRKSNVSDDCSGNRN